MSNCVNIHNTVLIPKHLFNYRQFAKDVSNVNNLTKCPDDFQGHIMWWYLGTDNVWEEDEYIGINFGDHRSGHTWRDLKQTLKVLSQYFDTKCQVMFVMSDESDGFSSTYKQAFDINPEDS